MWQWASPHNAIPGGPCCLGRRKAQTHGTKRSVEGAIIHATQALPGPADYAPVEVEGGGSSDCRSSSASDSDAEWEALPDLARLRPPKLPNLAQVKAGKYGRLSEQRMADARAGAREALACERSTAGAKVRAVPTRRAVSTLEYAARECLPQPVEPHRCPCQDCWLWPQLPQALQ